MMLAGWGRYPRRACSVLAPRDEDSLRDSLGTGPVIARGAGRAYGDSALNPAATLSMRHLNRMIAFDARTGQLTAEAGVVLGDIISAFLPRGWFPAVTPGTRFVTLGGMIAANVHGKNHHKDGAFGNFVDWIDLMGPDGLVQRLSREDNAELFHWTLGGMGLTGIILRAAIRLRPVQSGWIRQEIRAADSLPGLMDIFENRMEATYSVAWIDCVSPAPALGRGLVMLGEHAAPEDLPVPQRQTPFTLPARRKLTVPFNAPPASLNRYSVRAFNSLYYSLGRRKANRDTLVGWDSYFYPLDSILHWNRIYGRRGLLQFQCALPLDSARAGLSALLSTISSSGLGSFLAVLKRFGPEQSHISFPMEGYTLALDFPVSQRSLALLERLDDIAIDHGGRFYLAKDARITAERFVRADPRAAAFAEMRRNTNLSGAFASDQSRRLNL